MKRGLLTMLLLQFFSFADSQVRSSNPDSLKRLLATNIPDTTKVIVCGRYERRRIHGIYNSIPGCIKGISKVPTDNSMLFIFTNH
jgi:hypothetical protein